MKEIFVCEAYFGWDEPLEILKSKSKTSDKIPAKKCHTAAIRDNMTKLYSIEPIRVSSGLRQLNFFSN